MENRRETLKIIGAIGTTCAFPFAANELYGQHQHADARTGAAARAVRTRRKFFTRSRIRDALASRRPHHPATDTPEP